MIKAVFFDVANTLLYKPDFYDTFSSVLFNNKIIVERKTLESNHRLISEVKEFPDKTSKEFYHEFNSLVLQSLGINPTDDLLAEIFTACSYLPWHPFPDTQVLVEIGVPLGIISNWDVTLQEKLIPLNVSFEWILGSGNEKIRKPESAFYQKIFLRTGFEPHEILYVGDSVKLDILPALKLGINAVLIDRMNLYPSSNLARIETMADLRQYL